MITTEDYTNGACYSIEKLIGKISNAGLEKLCSVFSGENCSYIGLDNTHTHNIMDAKIFRVANVLNNIEEFKNHSIRLFSHRLLIEEGKTPLQCLLEYTKKIEDDSVKTISMLIGEQDLNILGNAYIEIIREKGLIKYIKKHDQESFEKIKGLKLKKD